MLTFHKAHRTLSFKGPINDDYTKTDKFSLESIVWSPCGTEGMLNIKTAIELNPLSSTKPSLMTVSLLYATLLLQSLLELSSRSIPTILRLPRSTTFSGASARVTASKGLLHLICQSLFMKVLSDWYLSETWFGRWDESDPYCCNLHWRQFVLKASESCDQETFTTLILCTHAHIKL